MGLRRNISQTIFRHSARVSIFRRRAWQEHPVFCAIGRAAMAPWLMQAIHGANGIVLAAFPSVEKKIFLNIVWNSRALSLPSGSRIPRGQRCPASARSRYLPHVPSLYAAILRGLAYDAAIFHTIILHIVGSLNHPRQGGHDIPSSCGPHCNRSRWFRKTRGELERFPRA